MELKGKKIAILATDGFEQSELFEPKCSRLRCTHASWWRYES